MDSRTSDQSLVSLLRELRDETTTLVRQEIALAKAETCEKVTKMARNVGYIAGGAILAYTGLILVLLSMRDFIAAGLISAGLSAAVAAGLASLIVAVIIAVASWALIAKGRAALKNETLVPEKTIESVKEDQQFIKQKLART